MSPRKILCPWPDNQNTVCMFVNWHECALTSSSGCVTWESIQGRPYLPSYSTTLPSYPFWRLVVSPFRHSLSGLQLPLPSRWDGREAICLLLRRLSPSNRQALPLLPVVTEQHVKDGPEWKATAMTKFRPFAKSHPTSRWGCSYLICGHTG